MNTKNDKIQPKKRYGCSVITKKSVRGSASTNDFLFYFEPATNGVAYVILTRIKNYPSYIQCGVRCTGSNYSKEFYHDSVNDYLHEFEFSGLKTNETYTFEMMWLTTDEELLSTEITRTYYCDNTTPGVHPYAEENGTTIVPLYDDNYPRYALDIECDVNRNNIDGRCRYDDSTRNLFWWVCATNYENHPITSKMDNIICCRWPPGIVYVNVTYKSTTNKSAISARINEWIDWMNDLVSFAGVTFKLGSSTNNNTRQINVIVGTHSQLWGYNPDDASSETYIYGGTWESMEWGHGLIEARVKICCESRYPFNQNSKLFQGIVYEELTEACGPGYDQRRINNTIFSEIAYPGKTVGGPEGADWTRDENVIKILYSLGYLRGYANPSYEYITEFGSGITHNKSYYSYGPLESAGINLFFQMNISNGSISNAGSLPATLYPKYKSQRTYNMSAIYATKSENSEVIGYRPEQESGLSFRYTNPSSMGTPYFSLPKKPSFTNTARINGGYKVNVNGLNTSGEKYYFQAYLKDVTDENIDNFTYCGISTSNYDKSSVTLNSLLYGRKYKFYLYSCYNDSIDSDWIYIGEGTVAPARPIIKTCDVVDGVITVSWELAADSEISYVYFSLYDSDDNLVGSSYALTFANETSGTFSFPKVDDGKYIIKSSSVLQLEDGTMIWSVDDQGDDGSTNNGDYKYRLEYQINIGDAKPTPWNWRQEYNLLDGGQGTICSTAYIPFKNNNFHPFTAEEWNRFVNKINEVRAWAKSVGKTVSGDELTEVDVGSDFISAYWAAVQAIKNIDEYGSHLPEEGDTVTLSASLFTGSGSLRDELNAILK